MPHLDPTPPRTAPAEHGRQARRERAPLDDLLLRVESMAVALARQGGAADAPPPAPAYEPERDAALLQLWRTARRAYEGDAAPATARESPDAPAAA